MRYVQIISPFLTQPRGSIVSQDRLSMPDDKLDEFIAAGYAIECEIEEEEPPPTAEATTPVAAASAAVPPRRQRKAK